MVTCEKLINQINLCGNPSKQAVRTKLDQMDFSKILSMDIWT